MSAEPDYGPLEDKVYHSIFRAYSCLYNLGIHSGHWDEVRSTALVGLCLELREPINSEWLNCIKSWLLEQQRPMENGMASWGEELWDTSMALISLSHLGLPQKKSEYQKAIRWIVSMYDRNSRHNWHDEPWETSWCLLAFLETDAKPELSDIVYNGTKWLIGLQDIDGKVVSPHYTAYLVLICSKLMNYNLTLSQEDKDTFSSTINKACEYLLSIVSKGELWTGECWSNGQIVWALSSTGNFPCDDKEFTQKVVDWFIKQQNEDTGAWDDVEDTASSILGLFHLLRELERMNGSYSDPSLKLASGIKSPVLCLKRSFIQRHSDGYISINISPKLKKIMSIILPIASAAIAITRFWNNIVGLFSR